MLETAAIIRTTICATGLLVAVLITLSACGGRSGPRLADSVTPSPVVIASVTPPPGTRLSVDEAIQLATDNAVFMDPDTLQETTVDLNSSGVWTVTFKGLFYEPAGPPPPPTETPRARGRVCSEVVVTVLDSNGLATGVRFRRADSCS